MLAETGAVAHQRFGPRRPTSHPPLRAMTDALTASSLYINRELSWLEFNDRVLAEACDDRNPLLERLKFLSIVSTNLDEFYMVRVAGLRRQVAAGMTKTDADGMLPQAQLEAIYAHVRTMLGRQRECLHERVLPGLAERGVRLLGVADLEPAEWLAVDQFFESQVFPVLTPLAVDPGHPFPYISNLSLSLAVEIRDTERGIDRFARVKVPKSLPRWVPIARPNHFVPLEEVIGANLGALFPGMQVIGSYTFRLTRYSDIDVGQLGQMEDLLETIEEQVFQRRFGEVARLEVQDDMPSHLRSLLLDELRENDHEGGALPLTEQDIYEMGPILELGDLMALATIDVPELRDPPFVATVPVELRDPHRTIFDVIRERDLLVHHPFESFAATTEHFIEQAANDDQVLAIKLTLYRTSGDTVIVRALNEAAEQGKQVAVLVELQARGDETNNIAWARQLEDYGVHVAYGLPGLKTHCKVALVVRREADGIRRYMHIGTGNYNSKTARLYTDMGLFTCSPSIGADITDLFNLLTGYSRQRLYRKLLVAPANMRPRILEMIDRESGHAREGRPARIVAKMNALVDPLVIQALYSASQAGVDIDLIVRGICCLRPGLEGVSDRIRVISIVGRFLEHSRLFLFGNGGEPEYYIGSADWMPRNFERRVEALTPIEDVSLHPRLESLLATCLADNRQAWELHADGSYVRRTPGDEPELLAQRRLLRDPWGRSVDTPPLGVPVVAREG